MGFPGQPQEPGQPNYPGGPGSYGQQPGGFSPQDPTQVPGGYPGQGGNPGQGGYQAPPPGGYPGPGGFQTPGGYQGPQPGLPGPKNNTLAVASLICGVAQFVLWFLFGLGFFSAIAALILGLVSMRQLKQRAEGGRGMAIAGVVLGALGILGGILLVIVIAAIGSANFKYGNYSNFGN
jgi:Domain of unknown function (DUF4190)